MGAAIRASGLKREEVFVTSKLWVNDVSEEGGKRGFEKSLKNLGLDYIDLYLIHQPYNDVYGAWRTLTKLHKEGRIKSIGVSNFYPDRLMDFCLNNEIKPAINQIERNPLHAQFEAQISCKSWAWLWNLGRLLARDATICSATPQSQLLPKSTTKAWHR